jgi:hypothetical protein
VHLLVHVEINSQVARRESERHKRRLRELTAQQQKLVQLYYDGGVSKRCFRPSSSGRGGARPGQTGLRPPLAKSRT